MAASSHARIFILMLLAAALLGSTIAAAQTAARQSSPDTPPAWIARPVTPGATVVMPGRYTVAPGDTMTRIAARTGASIEMIATANGLTPPYAIKVGQKLIIPSGRYHLVKRGESGIAIARAYGVAWRDIITINALEEPFLLREGQKLLLPAPASAPATMPAPVAPAPAPKKPVIAAPAAPASPPSPAPTPSSGAIEQRAEAFKLDIDDIVTGGEPALASTAKPVTPTPSPARTLPPTAVVAAPSGPFLGGFGWPVTGKLLRPFGDLGNGRRNDGINIAAPHGTPILAAADGVVAYVGTDVAIYGGLVLLRHADGWITAYGHAEKLLVKRGQSVRKGQPIASVAEAGLDEQDQLHFQIRQGRTPVDPLTRLAPR